mgnify:CR=1 FL=1
MGHAILTLFAAGFLVSCAGEAPEELETEQVGDVFFDRRYGEYCGINGHSHGFDFFCSSDAGLVCRPSKKDWETNQGLTQRCLSPGVVNGWCIDSKDCEAPLGCVRNRQDSNGLTLGTCQEVY